MKTHIYTIALVCLVVLIAWWAGLMPAQAQVVGGGGFGGGGGSGCITSGTSILQGNGSGGCSNLSIVPVPQGGTGLGTLTSHAVQVGAGTSTPSQVGPDSTSGQPLLSQGASSDPAYGALSLSGSGVTSTLPVANGGTGSNASGAVASSNVGGGWAANVNLTGTDTISLSGGNQKLSIGANETLTIQSGTIANTPSATNVYTSQLEICQFANANCLTGSHNPVACCTGMGTGTCGNSTLTFAAGTGITNFQWYGSGTSGATLGQLGYTLTQGNGDQYLLNYDGTNLKVSEPLPNTPC